MQIGAITSINNRNVIGQQYRKNSNINSMTQPSFNNTQNQVAFKGWFEDIIFYFPKLNESIRDEKREKQISKVENMVHDDVKFIAERQNIPLEEAKRRFNDTIESVAIPLKKDGKEVGLNKIIGYAPEKYQAMRDLLVPLKYKGTDKSKDYPIPNGMLVYGPKNTGKTHFVKALGEHAYNQLGYGKVEFRQFWPKEKTKNGDGSELMEFFYDAESNYKRNGCHQILFFDDLEYLLNSDYPEVTDVFLGMTDRCADRGVTWIATTNNPEKLPDALFKPFRLNSDINIKKISNAEKSAVMSYMWRQKERHDKTDHKKLLNEYNHSFNFYPPEMKSVADSADKYLSDNVDKYSLIHTEYNWDKGNVRKKEKSPVKTELAEKFIDDYIKENNAKKILNKEKDIAQVNIENEDKLLVYAKRYSQKDAKPFVKKN